MVTLQKTGLSYVIMMRKKHFVVLLLVCVNYQVLCEYLSLSEGDSCTWDGLNGTCVQLHRCLSAKDFIQSENQPPICDFKGKVPVICCVDCDLVDDARNIIIGDIGLIYLNGQKAHDQCVNFKHKLRTFQKHVVIYYDKEWTVEEESNCQELQYIYKGAVAPAGGNDVWRGQFPHMALLGYGTKWTTAQWLCAGSIISHKFVLTAGHCISSPSVGPVTYLGLGVLKRTDPPGRWERYRVKRIIAHPDYHPPSKYNDIALLETFTPIVFNSYARPACINMRENLTAKYNEATGWGKLGYRRELADNMQVIYLEEFSEEECKREYPPHRHLVNGYNHTTQMCYGRRDQLVDTCEGDSGGPLHDKEEDSDHIIGVTSYGRACAVSTGAGIYTRVSFYLPWIESIVWPDA